MRIKVNYTDKIRAIDAKFKAQEIAFSPVAFQTVRALLETGLLQKISDSGDEGISVRQFSASSGISEYGVGVLAEIMYRYSELADAIEKAGFHLVCAHHNLGTNFYSILNFRKDKKNERNVCF